MTASHLVWTYEQSFAINPVIFGTPNGSFSPEEEAGRLIKEHGLEEARALCRRRAENFPASWNHWSRVLAILEETQAA